MIKVGGIYNYRNFYEIIITKKNDCIYGYDVEENCLKNNSRDSIIDYLKMIIHTYEVDTNNFFSWEEPLMQDNVEGYLGQIDEDCLRNMEKELYNSSFQDQLEE